jgi:hypothetical protein
MSDLTEYTHLLNLYTWFNEASIQGLLTGEFNGNYGEAELLTRATSVKLQEVADALANVDLSYLFNKPNVGLANVEPVPVADIQVAVMRPGIGKVQIQNNSGGGSLQTSAMNAWKNQGWQNDSNTGLYYNNFQVLPEVGLGAEDWIGIAVTCLEVVLVVLVKSGRDDSSDPSDPSDPSEPVGPGTCHVEGIEFCDEEEDDCIPDPNICANFTEAH